MGLATPIVQLLACLGRAYSFRGSVLTLGVQFVEPSRGEVDRAVALAAGEVEPAAGGAGGAPPADGKAADDRFVLSRLGFAEVSRLDISDGEGAEIVADLTKPLPAPLADSFDAILDGGTMEHIFNQPAAMANLNSCLRVGGLMIHISPFAGWENHGFFQMSPKMLGRLWAGSGFREIQAWLVDLPRPGSGEGLMPAVRPVVDFDGLVETDSKRIRTLLVLVARKERSAPLASPIDSHLGPYAMPAERCRAADEGTLAALRRLGLLDAPAKKRRWFASRTST